MGGEMRPLLVFEPWLVTWFGPECRLDHERSEDWDRQVEQFHRHNNALACAWVRASWALHRGRDAREFRFVQRTYSSVFLTLPVQAVMALVLAWPNRVSGVLLLTDKPQEDHNL